MGGNKKSEFENSEDPIHEYIEEIFMIWSTIHGTHEIGGRTETSETIFILEFFGVVGASPGKGGNKKSEFENSEGFFLEYSDGDLCGWRGYFEDPRNRRMDIDRQNHIQNEVI